MKYENYFVEEVKNYNMTDPLEILNWYRNLYYKEGNHTERCIVAEAINNVFMQYKEALEKQVPEKPDLEGDGYWDGELIYDTGYCPRCRQDYEIKYHTPKFCWNCGQALDWDEIEIL